MPRSKRQKRADLPNVLWGLVFGFLPLHCVFLNCRLVCVTFSKVRANFVSITASTKHSRHICEHATEAILRDDGPFLPWQGLRRLSLTSATGTCDLRDCPNLEEVKLEGCGFRVLLDELPLLRVMHVSGASDVIGVDAGFPNLASLHLSKQFSADANALVSCILQSKRLTALGVRMDGPKMLTVLQGLRRPWNKLVLHWTFFRGLSRQTLHEFMQAPSVSVPSIGGGME